MIYIYFDVVFYKGNNIEAAKILFYLCCNFMKNGVRQHICEIFKMLYLILSLFTGTIIFIMQIKPYSMIYS